MRKRSSPVPRQAWVKPALLLLLLRIISTQHQKYSNLTAPCSMESTDLPALSWIHSFLAFWRAKSQAAQTPA